MALRMDYAAQRRFQEWLGPDTWYSDHPNDRQRFFLFIHALFECNEGPIDYPDLLESIWSVAEKKHNWQRLHFLEEISHFISDAQTVAEYRLAVSASHE